MAMNRKFDDKKNYWIAEKYGVGFKYLKVAKLTGD